MGIRSREEWLKELHQINEEVLQKYQERSEELRQKSREESKRAIIRKFKDEGVEYLLNDPTIRMYLEE